MKKILTTIALALFCVAGFSQAKQPTLMVKADDNWYQVNNMMLKSENIGKVESVPDYERSFLESSDLKIAIQTINALMNDRGFPLKDMEQTLKIIKQKAAEDMASSREAEESILDQVKKRAKCDITLDLNWQVKAFGLRKAVDVQLRGLDAYTGKQIASLQSTSEPASSFDLAAALRECLAGGFDAFCNDLMQHFEDMGTNGREITLRIKTEAGSDINLEEAEIDGMTLGEFVEDWLSKNCVNGVFSTLDATETMMEFEQVRIPLYNEQGRAMDARAFIRGLQKLIKDAGFAGTKVEMMGLGNAAIYIAN